MQPVGFKMTEGGTGEAGAGVSPMCLAIGDRSGPSSIDSKGVLTASVMLQSRLYMEPYVLQNLT